MNTSERATELSKFFKATNRRLIVLMLPEDDDRTFIPAFVARGLESIQRCAVEWPRGIVVSSGIKDFKTGDLVATNFTDGLVFTGGEHDQDSLSVSSKLLPGETLKFFRPLRSVQGFNRRRSTDSQVDLSEIVIGLGA